MTMTSLQQAPSFGPPQAIFELTVEQRLTVSKMEHVMPRADKETLVKLLVALQTQNFCLSNNITNLVSKWPLPTMVLVTTSEEASKRGTSSEIKV